MPRAKARVEEDFLDDSDSEGSVDERDLADATLPEPIAVQIKVSTIHRRYRNGLIELNPYYQRDVVWPTHRQSGLINSIFNNYYIPPVIFQVIKVYDPATPNARPTIYQTAIDGKQRLSSIIEFMAGRIPYKDPRGVTWWYPVLEAKKRKGRLLTKELKDRFDNWSLLCIEYEGLKQQQEEDLFARVQQGMALSNNEKQMASHTPWIKLIKEIMKSFKAVTELCLDLKRGKDFGNVANVIVMAVYNDMRKTNEPLGLKTSQASLSKVVNKMDYGPPSAKFSDRMRLLFKVWTELYNASPQTFSNEWTGQILKNFAPIEYLATGVLLHMHMDVRDNETLITDIAAMRKYIRTGGKALDLRTNTNTWRWFWSFISELDNHQGKGRKPSAASRVIPKAVPLEVHGSIPNVQKQKLVLASGPVAPSSATPKRTTAKARKTAVESEESDIEAPLSPPRKTRKTNEAVTQASARKRTIADMLDDDDEDENPISTTKRKSRSAAQSRSPQRPTLELSDDETEDDEIFKTDKSQANSAAPVQNQQQQQQPIQNMPMQNSVPQAQTFPNFSPEMFSMFAAQMQAFQQQHQNMQQQQQQNQGQSYQNASAMMPQFQFPMGFPTMPSGQQQWQNGSQQPLAMQQPATPLQQESHVEVTENRKSGKRKGVLNIDL